MAVGEEEILTTHHRVVDYRPCLSTFPTINQVVTGSVTQRTETHCSLFYSLEVLNPDAYRYRYVVIIHPFSRWLRLTVPPLEEGMLCLHVAEVTNSKTDDLSIILICRQTNGTLRVESS